MRPYLLSLLAFALTGCAVQHDCATACDKLFGSKAGECEIAVAGNTPAEMISDCRGHCEQAMAQAGEVGDYNPNERSSGNEDVGLDNDAQAALWMDCVDETACADLKDNYCAPTTNYP